jgi:hypothetical protein
VYEPSNPGQDVIDFVMIHLGLHEQDRDDPDRLEEHYQEAAERVTDLAKADPVLCLSLLADLAGHFAKTLEQHGPPGAVGHVIRDWAGRGWTSSVLRAGPIKPTPVPISAIAAPVAPETEERWPAGSAPF